jgi:hypothetical protein
MKLENHPFFKKYRYLKYILLAHLAFCILVITTELVHGIIRHDIVGVFEEPYKDYKALYNPEKYLEKVSFVVDTAFIEVHTSSSKGSSPTHRNYTIIKGNVLNSKIKREISCPYDVLDRIYRSRFDYNIGEIITHKVKSIKVLKSKLNDNLFLGNERFLNAEKDNAIGGIYFHFSFIVLLIVLYILKKKSEIKEPRLKKERLS